MRANLTRSHVLAAVISVAVLLLSAGKVRTQEAEAPADLDARIERLIKQLDDDKFQVREEAEQEWAQSGEPAVSKLTAATKDSSFERAERAGKLLKEIRRARIGLRHIEKVIHQGLAGAVTVVL